ncbi:MAG: ferric reductase domain protein transmembrane component protein [uncultured bacterium]|nr:MAG: ferric reductase domain protein transmembrane component protein [uncultured bacterium]
MTRKIFIFACAVFLSWPIQIVKAEEMVVDYGENVIVDMDLDGITDQGEIQIFQTDPKNSDTDGDGFSDGVEVIGGTDANDKSAYPGAPVIVEESEKEIPWAWYGARAAGLVAFVLLYISIFLGLTLRIPLLRKIFAPVYSMRIHAWISLQATLLALLHGGFLFFDKYLKLSLADIFIPFVSSYEPVLLPLGILSFYLMVVLVATSYGRKYISQRIWRITHFTNIALYAMVLVHIFGLGTDLKNPIVFNIFLYANAFLVLLMLINMQLRIAERIRMRKEAALSRQANIGQNDNPSIQN